MFLILAIFSFIVGSVFASFIGVIAYRLPRGMSIVKPDSFCPSCKHSIKWYDNIPIISYIILGGKCRYCKGKIGISSLIFEIIGGISFLLIFLQFGISIDTLFLMAICFILLMIGLIDYYNHFIYDWSNYTFLGLSLIYIIYLSVMGKFVPIEYLIGGLLGFGVFLLIRIVGKLAMKQECLGMGDVILMGAGGLLLGYKSLLLAVLIASVFGAILSLVLIALKIKSREDEIPFGPYLILGIYIAMVYGKTIIDWYLGVMF